MENTQKVCRLCMSEEMLEDVFKLDHDAIIQRISDLLSIVVSEDDQISRFICVICRARLFEFHDFKLSCLEVQDVLRNQFFLDVKKESPPQESKQIIQSEIHGIENSLPEEVIEQEASNVETDHTPKILKNSTSRKKKLLKFDQKQSTIDSKLVKKNLVVCKICGKKVLKACMQAHQDKHQSYKSGITIHYCERGCIGVQFNCRRVQLQHYVNFHNFSPVKCPICHKIFRAKSSLNYHTKSVHEKKGYFCSICMSSYPIKYLLDQHMKVHSSELEYNCSMCDYATHLKHNLTRHMHSHARQETKRTLFDPEWVI